jgi:hypothetical protein
MVAYYAPRLVISVPLQLLTALAVCLFALWRGQRYERIIAGIFLADGVLAVLLSDQLQDPQGSLHIWIDGIELAVIAPIAVRSGAPWLICQAALQLLRFATVLVHAYAPEVAEPYAYVSLYIIWNLGSYAILVIATLLAMQRAKAEARLQSA